MSARVFKPISLLEMSRLRSSSPMATAGAATTDRRLCKGVLKARRALFGPVDHVQTQRFLEEEMAKQAAYDRERWEFDFVNELPLSKGIYEWSLVNVNNMVNVRPLKRRPEDEESFDILDLYCEPSQVMRRMADEEERMSTDETTPVKETVKKQRLITGKFLSSSRFYHHWNLGLWYLDPTCIHVLIHSPFVYEPLHKMFWFTAGSKIGFFAAKRDWAIVTKSQH